MKHVEALLAWRYLRNTAYQNATSTMVLICFLSIMIGSFSLTLVTAVMRGFEMAVHEKMQSIHPHATIDNDGQDLDAEALLTLIKHDFTEVIHTSPSVVGHAVAYPDDEGAPRALMVKGVYPEQEEQVSTIASKIIDPTEGAELARIINGNQVLIGRVLANILGVSPGDMITLFYTPSLRNRSKKLTMKQEDVVIGGVYKTGLDDFDASVIYAPMDIAQRIAGSEHPSHISLLFAPGAHQNDLMDALSERTDMNVYSWYDRYPALVSSLILEKYAMFLVIALITLVASMNIISLLFMQITQKRPDIAILSVMGMNPINISRIFFYMGISISFGASLCGIGLAWLASELLERYPFIELPDVYYTSHIPAYMDWYTPPLVWGTVMLISILATWIPLRHIKYINIADVLRFEG